VKKYIPHQAIATHAQHHPINFRVSLGLDGY